MKQEEIFNRLWADYTAQNPSAGRIYDLFTETGNRVVNDHVAFRTFDDKRVDIQVIAKPFLEAGYVPANAYHFTDKNLNARHFELPGDSEAPRVFISELILEKFSRSLREKVRRILDQQPDSQLASPELIFSGAVFGPPSLRTYEELREESEYAAWLYVFGYRANHFTVSVNHLDTFRNIREVNKFLKSKGIPMNSSGGEVKGSPEMLLEQSSTLADRVEVEFEEGTESIPACYYEFAQRYKDKDGRLFNGFIAGSADKIFESTDFRK